MDPQHRLVSGFSNASVRPPSRTLDRPICELRSDLQHFAYRDISDHLETIDRYTTYASRQMFEDGRRAGILQIAGHPPLAFLRNYVARGGFRDGAAGLIISALNSYYVFLKFAKLRELELNCRKAESQKGSI